MHTAIIYSFYNIEYILLDVLTFRNIMILINILLLPINIILYVKHFKKYFYKHFYDIEIKFWNNVKMLLNYYLKQKVIKTNGKRKLTEEQKSWKGYNPTLGHEVVILNFNSNLNVGSIYRSSCCLGVKKYHIFGKKKYLPSSQVGYNFIPIEYHDVFPKIRDRYDESSLTIFNKEILDEFLSKKVYNIYLVEQGGQVLKDISFKKNKSNKIDLIIFGNESFGIPKNLQKYILDNYDARIISVDQIGIAKSLNVSNCASIVLYEYMRQNINNFTKLYHTEC